jgi:hypothetical protein
MHFACPKLKARDKISEVQKYLYQPLPEKGN